MATELSETAAKQMYVDELYELWLRNAPRLYEFCTTHVLPTPSHCVTFLEDSRRYPPARDYSIQQIAVGTTATDVNYVSVYDVFVPTECEELEYVSAEELQTFAGYTGRWSDVAHLMHRHQRVVHDGPVHRICAMPQTPHVLATRGPSPHIYLFDLGKRRQEPEDTTFRPDMRLRGAKRDGHGLQWHPVRHGHIAASSRDQHVYIWDLEGQVELLGTRGCTELSHIIALKGHKDEVEDVSFHHTHPDVVASCSLDKTLIMWDYRVDKPQQTEKVHRDAVHGVEFHPTAAFMVATCSADKSCRVWDIRKFYKPIMELVGHTDTVTNVKWAPFNDTVLLTTSLDRSVICWDLGKHDCPEGRGDENAAPELVFRHVGHTGTVRDATFAPFTEDEWVIASTCDNNMLQIWAPQEGIYNDEIDIDQYNLEVI